MVHLRKREKKLEAEEVALLEEEQREGRLTPRQERLLRELKK